MRTRRRRRPPHPRARWTRRSARASTASCTVSNHPAPTAARVAAPCAAPSAVEVVTIAAPSTSARIRRHRSLLLPPPVALIWFAGRNPGRPHQFERVPQTERHTLQHRTRQMSPAVVDRQTHERAPGEGVGVRGALPGEVGKEQEAIAPGGDRRRLLDELLERDPGREGIAEPTQAARRREHHAHEVPPAGEGVAEGVEPALGLDRRAPRSSRTARRRCRATAMRRPAPTEPTPTAAAAWSPPPAITGVPARSPVAAAAASVIAPVTSVPRRSAATTGARSRARRRPRGTSRAPRGRTASSRNRRRGPRRARR